MNLNKKELYCLFKHIASIYSAIVVDLCYPERLEDIYKICNGAHVCLGKISEIVIGSCKNNDEEIATFFHELGHVINNIPKDHDLVEAEYYAWDVGFDLAYEYGFLITEKMWNLREESLKKYELIRQIEMS